MTSWPEKMITQAEAFAKAANWPVYAKAISVYPDPPDESEPHLDAANISLWCGKCHQSTGQLCRDGVAYNSSLDEMLSMVLRHMVQAHDVPLNTRGKQDNGPSGGSTP